MHKGNNSRYFCSYVNVMYLYVNFCCCSVAQSCPTLWPSRLQHIRLPCPSPCPGTRSNPCPFTVMPSNHLILCCPLLLPPSIFPSIRIFLNESVLRIRWPKCWSFSFSISPSSEYSGLTSFRMDWLDLLAVQGTPYQCIYKFKKSRKIHTELLRALGCLWRLDWSWGTAVNIMIVTLYSSVLSVFNKRTMFAISL